MVSESGICLPIFVQVIVIRMDSNNSIAFLLVVVLTNLSQ